MSEDALLELCDWCCRKLLYLATDAHEHAKYQGSCACDCRANSAQCRSGSTCSWGQTTVALHISCLQPVFELWENARQVPRQGRTILASRWHPFHAITHLGTGARPPGASAIHLTMASEVLLPSPCCRGLAAAAAGPVTSGGAGRERAGVGLRHCHVCAHHPEVRPACLSICSFRMPHFPNDSGAVCRSRSAD
jgi:hypothetical protein